jgi:hypothetical protein
MPPTKRPGQGKIPGDRGRRAWQALGPQAILRAQRFVQSKFRGIGFAALLFKSYLPEQTRSAAGTAAHAAAGQQHRRRALPLLLARIDLVRRPDMKKAKRVCREIGDSVLRKPFACAVLRAMSPYGCAARRFV